MVHPGGVHRHLRRGGVRPHRQPGGVRRRRRPDAAVDRHDDRDGACPATVRRGCCPDAAAAPRCGRHHDRCRRGGNPCPVRARRGCCPDGVRHRDGRPRGGSLPRERRAVSPVGALVAFPGSDRPGCPAGQERGCSPRPGRPGLPGLPEQPEQASPPERLRSRTGMPAEQPEQPVLPERRGSSVLRARPGRVPRERPGLHLASGPTARGPRGVTVRGRSWRRRCRGMRREASSRRGPRWWTRLNGRIRPVPAVSQLRLSRLYRALWRAHVRGPWPHFSCLGPHRARHEPSISC